MVWYEYPPYTQYVKDFDINEQPVYKGIFYQIVNEMLTEVCGDCKQVKPSYIQVSLAAS